MKCRCQEIDHAKTYASLKSMIGRVAKDVADAKAESHTRLGAFHQIMERIEGKVDAVLEQVMPKDAVSYTRKSKYQPNGYQSEPVTDESGVSVGAGAGPLIKDTQPADQHAAFISAIEAIKVGQRFSIHRSAGLSVEEFSFLHNRLIYRGWTILENIADMKWEMIPPYRAT